MTLILKWLAGIRQRIRLREIICSEVNTSITLIFQRSTVAPVSVIGAAPRAPVAESSRRAGWRTQLIVSLQILSIADQLCDKHTDSNKHNCSCAVVFVRFSTHSYGWKRAGILGFNQIHLIQLEGLISLCGASVGLIPCQLYTHPNSNKPFCVKLWVVRWCTSFFFFFFCTITESASATWTA